MFKKFTLITFLFSFLFNFCIAQSDTLRWQPGLKLSFSDFSIDPATTQVFADIVVHYEYGFQPLKMRSYLPIAHAHAVLNRSTATLPYASERALRYAQLFFDLAGYQARLMELKVYELGELNDKDGPLRPVLDRIFLEAGNEVSQIKKEMVEQLSRADNVHPIAEWEARVADLLRNTPEIVETRTVADSQLGIFAGITRHIFTGKTEEHFTDATGFDIGFQYDVKKSSIGLDIALGFNKTNNQVEGKGEWPAGMRTNLASIELTYGLKFRKNQWLTVPFAGLGINEFTPAKSDNDDKRRVTGYSPVVGLELNRIFKNKLDSQSNIAFFYRIRASVNPSNLIKNYAGTQVNLKLAVGFDLAKVKRKLVKKGELRT